MTHLLAEDLFLLCWDNRGGGVHRACAHRLGAAAAGALVVDAMEAGVVVLDDDAARRTGTEPDDASLDRVLDAAGAPQDPQPLDAVIRGLVGGTANALRDRLVASGDLRVERRRRLLVLARTQHALRDPGAADELRHTTWSLLTGRASPAEASPRELRLAALASAGGAVDLLVEESEQPEASDRAHELAARAGILALLEAVEQVQLVDWARANEAALAGAHQTGLAAGGIAALGGTAGVVGDGGGGGAPGC